MFLTHDDLQELTGYVQAAAQIRWLQKNRIRHFVRADGHPVVTRDALQASPAPSKAPNFAALRVRH